MSPRSRAGSPETHPASTGGWPAAIAVPSARPPRAAAVGLALLSSGLLAVISAGAQGAAAPAASPAPSPIGFEHYQARSPLHARTSHVIDLYVEWPQGSRFSYRSAGPFFTFVTEGRIGARVAVGVELP